MSAVIDYLHDWDNSGSFLGLSEIITNRVDGSVSVVCVRGKDQIRQFAPPMTGYASLVVHNIDGLLSPGNTDSPIYPNATPFKRFLMRYNGGVGLGLLTLQDNTDLVLQDDAGVSLQDTGTRNIFTGYSDDLRPSAWYTNPIAGLSVLGTLNRLVGKIISTPVYENITIDQALAIVLDKAGWPALERVLDIGLTTLRYFCVNGQDAFQVCVELVATEGVWASFFPDSDGNFVFKNRDALTTETVSTMSQYEFTDMNSQVQDLDYDPNYKNVVRACKVESVEREPQAVDVVWGFGDDALILAANEERVIEWKASEWFINAVAPRAVGTNAEQLLSPSVLLTNGSFIANVNGVDTSAINYNDSTSTIQSIFDTAVGAGNTFLTGTLATGLRVRFIGDLAGKAIPLITIKSSLNVGSAPGAIEVQYDGDGTDGVWKIYPRAPLASGTFKLKSINGNTTLAISFNANDTTIKLRLEALALISPGDVTVSAGNIDTDTLTVTFTGALAGQVVPLSVEEATTLTTATAATATINVTETIKGGGPDYIVTAGGIALISLDDTSGAGGVLRITASASGLTLTGLQVRAQSLPIVRTHSFTYPIGSTVPDGQVYKPTIRPEIPRDFAEAYARLVFAYYENPRPAYTVTTITSLFDPANAALFDVDIGYRVRIANEFLGIDEDAHIQRIEFEIAGLQLIGRFGCERAIELAPSFRV